jgi:hypothetical protein
MRNISLAKWWPLAALAVVGLTVMTAALVPLRPHVAIQLIHPIAMKMTCALTPTALAADDSTDAKGDSTGSYDYDFSGDKNDVVRMGEDIEIGADQTVHGDVVAIGGRATIYGHVRGDVVSIGGGIHLMPGCVVDGDAVVVGGIMDREEGATVHGQNVSVAGFPKAFGRWWMPRTGHHYRADSGESSSLCVVRDTLRYIAFFVVGMILCLALPQKRGIVRSTLRSRFWMSLLVGFGSTIGLMVGLVLLCITCIGIVVAVPAFFASLVVIAAAGAVGFSLLGDLIARRAPREGVAWLGSFALGLLPVFVIHVIGRVLTCSSDGGSSEMIGRALVGIAKTAWAVLILSGFGALILTRLGTRDPSMPPPPPAWARMPGMPVPPPAYPGPSTPSGYAQSGSGWQPPTPPKPPES